MSTPSATAPAGQALTLRERIERARRYHGDDKDAGVDLVRIPVDLFNELLVSEGRDEVHWRTRRTLLAQNAALKAALENVLGFCATNQGMEAQMAMDDARAALGVSP